MFQLPQLSAAEAAAAGLAAAAAAWCSWTFCSNLMSSHKAGEQDAILVTGAGSGIGRASSLELNRSGFKVFAGVMNTKEGEDLVAASSNKQRMIPIVLDVTSETDIQRAVAHISKEVGMRGLKGLFSNAGVPIKGVHDLPEDVVLKGLSVQNAPLELFRKTFDVNFFGTVAVTQACIPLLRLARGKIILNASVTGKTGLPFVSPYSSSKHAVEGFGDSLRRELRSKRVQVSILECGAIGTNIWRDGRVPVPVNSDYPSEISARAMVSYMPVVPASVPARIIKNIMLSKWTRARYQVNPGFPFWLLPDWASDTIMYTFMDVVAFIQGKAEAAELMAKFDAKFSPFWDKPAKP